MTTELLEESEVELFILLSLMSTNLPNQNRLSSPFRFTSLVSDNPV